MAVISPARGRGVQGVYSGSIHSFPIQYLYFGLHGKNALVPWIWTATFLNITRHLLLTPRTRENFTTLNIACVFMIIGVYIEKGMGLIIPGIWPVTPLGRSMSILRRIRVLRGDRHLGVRGVPLHAAAQIAIPIYTGKLRFETRISVDQAPADVVCCGKGGLFRSVWGGRRRVQK